MATWVSHDRWLAPSQRQRGRSARRRLSALAWLSLGVAIAPGLGRLSGQLSLAVQAAPEQASGLRQVVASAAGGMADLAGLGPAEPSMAGPDPSPSPTFSPSPTPSPKPYFLEAPWASLSISRTQSLRLEGQATSPQPRRYRLRLSAAGELHAALHSDQPAALSIAGLRDEMPRLSVLDQASEWRGHLEPDQAYAIQVVPLVDAALDFELQLSLDSPMPGATPLLPQLLHVRPSPTPSSRHVYLSFDDGPAPVYTEAVLDLLAEHRAPATFFVLANQAKLFPDILAKVRASGHAVAQHGSSHQSLAGLRGPALLAEIEPLERLLGSDLSPCFRPPYGAEDAHLRVALAERGTRTLIWDIDPFDWQQPGPDAIHRRVMDQLQPGALILLHDGGGDRSQTVEALARLLPDIRAAGYTFSALCRARPSESGLTPTNR